MILMRISVYIRILKELDSRADYEKYKKAVVNTDGVHVWLDFRKRKKKNLFWQVWDFGRWKNLDLILRGY